MHIAVQVNSSVRFS